MSDRLNIANEMSCLDRKDRTFYSSLTDEERKKFSTYLMIRWSSAIQGSAELQEYYLQSCNHYLNRNFFDIGRHPKLQWLCATAVSPGLGTHRHAWIAPKKREPGASAVRKQLGDLYPHLRDDELDLMAQLNTKKDIDAHFRAMGQDTKK